MRRRATGLGLALLAALALSGCMRFTADLTVSENDTVDGSYVVAIEKGSGAAMGGSDKEIAQGLYDDSGLQTSFTRSWTHPYSKDGFSGIEVEFRDEPLATFAPTSDRFGITRDGDEFVVSGKASSTEAEQAQDAAGTPDMTITIAFPGAVTSSNGTIDGNTVTWNLVGGPPELEARASAVSNQSPWPAILVTALVLAALGVTFWPREPKQARRPGGQSAQRTTASGRPAAVRRV
ncbi:LppM family (lipo)protein [Demequina sp.]|uniref:LppM family (lipo)protein n=1 Tax=Demequina sp. TaxID=2050685 RepID=UPI003D15261D